MSKLSAAVITAYLMTSLSIQNAGAQTYAQPYFVDQTEKKSPDGTATAVLKRFSDKTSKLFYRPDEFQEFTEVEYFAFVIDDFTWLSDNQTVVYRATSDTLKPAHLYKTDVVRLLTTDLTPFPRRTAAGYYTSHDSSKLFVLLDLDEQDVFDVYQIDYKTRQLLAVEAPLEFPDTFQPKARPAASVLMPYQDPKALAAGDALLQIPLFSDTCKESLTGLHGKTVKPWTDQERKVAEETWQQVVRRVPGLVMRASNNHRIVFGRASEIPQTDFHLIPGVKPSAAPAQAHTGNLIVLTDVFFKLPRDERVFSMVHELTHVADLCGRYALSKEWTDLERKKIMAFRSALESRKSLGFNIGGTDDDHLAEHFDLPTAYSASSFMEALADITAYWVLGYRQPTEPEKEFIRKSLFTLNQEQMITDYNLIKTDVECKDHAKRLAAARQILRKEPESVVGRFLEATSLLGLKNRRFDALVSSRRLLNLLDRRGAFPGDYGYMEARYSLANAEFDLGNYPAALALLKVLRAAEPDDAQYKEAEKAVLYAIRRNKRQPP